MNENRLNISIKLPKLCMDIKLLIEDGAQIPRFEFDFHFIQISLDREQRMQAEETKRKKENICWMKLWANKNFIVIRLLLQTVNSFTKLLEIIYSVSVAVVNVNATTPSRLNDVFLFNKIIEKYLVINKYEGDSFLRRFVHSANHLIKILDCKCSKQDREREWVRQEC